MEDTTTQDTQQEGGSFISKIQGSLNVNGVPDDDVELVTLMLNFWRMGLLVAAVCSFLYILVICITFFSLGRILYILFYAAWLFAWSTFAFYKGKCYVVNNE